MIKVTLCLEVFFMSNLNLDKDLQVNVHCSAACMYPVSLNVSPFKQMSTFQELYKHFWTETTFKKNNNSEDKIQTITSSCELRRQRE